MYNKVIMNNQTNQMSGTTKGSLKKKLGLKGKTKPGDMIGKMNMLKGNQLKMGIASPKVAGTIKKII